MRTRREDDYFEEGLAQALVQAKEERKAIKERLLRLQYNISREYRICPGCQSERVLMFHRTVGDMRCYTCSIEEAFDNG